MSLGLRADGSTEAMASQENRGAARPQGGLPIRRLQSPASSQHPVLHHNPVLHHSLIEATDRHERMGRTLHLMHAKLTTGAHLLRSWTGMSPTVTTLQRSTLVLLTLRRAAQRPSG